MAISTSEVINFARTLKTRAEEAGFDDVRIARVQDLADHSQSLGEFLTLGRHGDMDWFESTVERRGNLRVLWPEAKSAIVLAMNYGQGLNPFARLQQRQSGVISQYALGRDYHDIVKGKLKVLAQWLARSAKTEVKVFVDTAPLMEKPLAQQAGLGWQGKHTNLVSRDLGSWFFLGVILTSAELDADRPETDHCGSCRACLDICPTKAFPAPYQLDARRCISYLTIEHKGHIAREFREAIGNRIYGCDDCLAVCPWNKFASDAREAKLAARAELLAPALADLAQLNDRSFRQLFSGSVVKRTGRDRFVRNVLIAIGNSGDTDLAAIAERLTGDASPLVRAMAVWALARLAPESFVQSRERLMTREPDPAVLDEWLAA